LEEKPASAGTNTTRTGKKSDQPIENNSFRVVDESIPDGIVKSTIPGLSGSGPESV
jgi:hypothetical protein